MREVLLLIGARGMSSQLDQGDNLLPPSLCFLHAEARAFPFLGTLASSFFLQWAWALTQTFMSLPSSHYYSHHIDITLETLDAWTTFWSDYIFLC
jgi:hypothetical protein